MNLFGWHLTFPERFRRRRQPRPPVRQGLRCEECGGGIHRRDHYVILTVRHRNCKDPKLTGQQSLPLDLAGTPLGHDPNLRFMGIDQEPVIMPPHPKHRACIERHVADLERQLAEAKKAVQDFRYGNNYIKQFLDAKDKCAVMYPPEEVYTKGQLELWAEENGYILRKAAEDWLEEK